MTKLELVPPIGIQHLKSLKLKIQEKYDSNFDLIGYEIDGDDLSLHKAVKILQKNLNPCTDREIKVLIADLMSMTAIKNHEVDVFKATIKNYTSRLKEYTGEIVRQVLTTWPDKSKWFPTWYDLKEELEWRDTTKKMLAEVEKKLVFNLIERNKK